MALPRGTLGKGMFFRVQQIDQSEKRVIVRGASFFCLREVTSDDQRPAGLGALDGEGAVGLAR